MQIKTTVRHHITPIRMTIFIVEKTYNMQCILLTFFFSVQYCIVNYIYIAVQQIFRNFSSCVTETPYPLNRNSLFPPHPNPWKPPLYVLLPTSIFFFFLAVLGLCCGLFSSCGEQGLLFIVVHGLLIAVASLVVEHSFQAHRLLQLRHVGSVVVARRLQSAGSVVLVNGLSCCKACGIFPDQGLNPCPLHWQADSSPLHHQGSPFDYF